MLSDPDSTVIKRYGVYDAGNEMSWPAVFVIGEGGTILATWVLQTFKERPSVEQILAAMNPATEP